MHLCIRRTTFNVPVNVSSYRYVYSIPVIMISEFKVPKLHDCEVDAEEHTALLPVMCSNDE